jgi:hypothetical protein
VVGSTGKFGVQGGPALARRLGIEFCAHLGVGRWHGRQSLEQCLEIQHRAANQHGQRAACMDGPDTADGVDGKFGGAIGLGGIADVDQVVGHLGLFVGRRFGGADVHTAIHQSRVDADDFDGTRASYRQGCGRLAAGGGTCQG